MLKEDKRRARSLHRVNNGSLETGGIGGVDRLGKAECRYGVHGEATKREKEIARFAGRAIGGQLLHEVVHLATSVEQSALGVSSQTYVLPDQGLHLENGSTGEEGLQDVFA